MDDEPSEKQCPFGRPEARQALEGRSYLEHPGQLLADGSQPHPEKDKNQLQK